MKPKVSIIMGIYNCGEYLKDCIESILNQTYQDWELIMCEDGSKDNTLEIANQYQKKYPQKIVLLKNEKNMGLNYTLNRCLEVAKGEYIARQDGDDIALLNRLEKQVEFLDKHPEYAIVGANMDLFDENGIWGQTRTVEKPKNTDFMIDAPFYHPICMVRKEAYDAVEGYTVDKKLLRVEDYHLWYKMYMKGYKGYNIQEVLYNFRDDKNAFKRRTFKSSINYARLRLKVFKDLKIPFTKYIYIIRPIAVSLLPRKIYEKLHKNKLKK